MENPCRSLSFGQCKASFTPVPMSRAALPTPLTISPAALPTPPDDIAGRIADITAGSGTRSGADGGAGRASGPCGAGGAGGVRVIGRLIANDAVVIINGAIIGPLGS